MGTSGQSAPECQPTLGWVKNGAFHALNNVFLQSLMDCPVRSWDDFSPMDRKRLRNLKCKLPSGRVVLGQVFIVKEFDGSWTAAWRATVWADGRRCLRVKHMVEEEDIVEVFDIDPIPAPAYSPQTTYVISADVIDVRYGGWTDHTCLFVLRRGECAAQFDVNFTTLEELDGVIYDIHTTSTLSSEGMAVGVLHVTADEVWVVLWNCRGIARASFRPNLFTICSLSNAQVIVLTNTRAAGKNARSLLNEATTMEYFYIEPMGFVGGTSVIWDALKVSLAWLTGEDNYVSFRLQVARK